jgi:carbon storage regulator CsrA
MLIIKRAVGERFRLKLPDGSECWVSVQELEGRLVSLGITAPRAVRILREEIIPRADRGADRAAGAV